MTDPINRHFNLATEPWIPVRWLDGTVGEVSLATALKEASQIEGLTGDIPQQVLPIIRVMLAVLYHSMPSAGNVTDLESLWGGIWSKGVFDPDAIDGYLEFFGSRFDLLDDKHPFYQVAGLEYVKGEPHGVKDLLADVQDLFSMRDLGRVTDLSPAEAARWLIFQQSYAVAGIKTPVRGNTHAKKGKAYAPKGSLGTGLLGVEGPVYLEGNNLFETLMLNWVLFDDAAHGQQLYGNELDLAAWERDDAVPDMVPADPERPRGPVDMFTWQSRRVRLVTNDGGRVVGVVSCYGDVIQSLDDRQASETMTAWREVKRAGMSRTSLVPRSHDPSRAIWRGLASMVTFDGGNDLRPGVIKWIERLGGDGVLGSQELPAFVVHAQGMSYGTQSSVFSDGIDDSMRVSRVLAYHDSACCREAVSVVAQIEEAVNLYCAFLKNVWKATGRKTDGSRAQVQLMNAESAKAREAAYGELDQICRQRIAEFPGEETAATPYGNAWRSDIHRRILTMAEGYIRSIGCTVFQEHDEMTIGAASMRLQRGLNKVLGPLGSKKEEGE